LSLASGKVRCQRPTKFNTHFLFMPEWT
jgi:hypothetical protein